MNAGGIPVQADEEGATALAGVCMSVTHVPRETQHADILTKPLAMKSF